MRESVFSPDEWSYLQGKGASPEFLEGRSADHPRISFRVSGPYGTELMLAGDPFGLREYASAPEQVERTVQILALVNANLPDDHRFTREDVGFLRWFAEDAGPFAAEAGALADRIAALLPPE